MSAGTVVVSVLPDPQFTHRIVLDAEGVMDAAVGVAEARGAAASLREERRKAHGEWRAKAIKNALKPGFEPGDEPNPGSLSHEEGVAFKAQLQRALRRLELAVAANGDAIVDAVGERELEVLEEARAAVQTLDACVEELKLLGKAVTKVAQARHRQPASQPQVTFDGLVRHIRRRGEGAGLLAGVGDA